MEDFVERLAGSGPDDGDVGPCPPVGDRPRLQCKGFPAQPPLWWVVVLCFLLRSGCVRGSGRSEAQAYERKLSDMLRGRGCGTSHSLFFFGTRLGSWPCSVVGVFVGCSQPLSRDALVRRRWRHFRSSLEPLSCYTLTHA